MVETSMIPDPAAAQTLAVGGTQQTLFAGLDGRRSWYFQNHSGENMYIRFDGTIATQDGNSTLVPPGHYARSMEGNCSGSLISIIGPTTGQVFSATQQVGVIVGPAGGSGLVKAESTLPTEASDGSLVAPLHRTFGEYVFAGFDFSSGSMLTTPLGLINGVPLKVTDTQLTAVGTTPATNVEGYLHHLYAITSVENTSTDVRYQFEGSTDGGTLYSLIFPDNAAETGYTSANGLHTVTADNTYIFIFANLKLTHIRFNWVTETGNTDATINPIHIHGN